MDVDVVEAIDEDNSCFWFKDDFRSGACKRTSSRAQTEYWSTTSSRSGASSATGSRFTSTPGATPHGRRWSGTQARTSFLDSLNLSPSQTPTREMICTALDSEMITVWIPHSTDSCNKCSYSLVEPTLR